MRRARNFADGQRFNFEQLARALRDGSKEAIASAKARHRNIACLERQVDVSLA